MAVTPGIGSRFEAILEDNGTPIAPLYSYNWQTDAMTDAIFKRSLDGSEVVIGVTDPTRPNRDTLIARAQAIAPNGQLITGQLQVPIVTVMRK